MRVLATVFDSEEGRDGQGRTFSEKWANDGHGSYCGGIITRVLVKKRGKPYTYKIKWDDGSTMNCEEQHVEQAIEEDSEDENVVQEDRTNEADMNEDEDADSRSEAESTNSYEGSKTDSETGVCEGEEQERGDVVGFGETVVCGSDDDPLRKTWTRIGDLTVDERTEETHETVFKHLRVDSQTTELDLFMALMPLKPADLLTLVREGGDRANDKNHWKLEHIMAALCIIFGGAQFKEGTDLWCLTQKGMMPPPDFGMYLSRDRFQRILRYWAFGVTGDVDMLREKPWEEVDVWVRAFNKNRKEELTFGTDLTPDEMMFAWRGKTGNGGIPHLSFIQRKPIPLGTELKVVCEGTMGLCGFLEIQKGKIAMARVKHTNKYKATTACTVRMVDKMGLKEIPVNAETDYLNHGKKRCIYADSWFASVETALACKNDFGWHFCGPVKTAHKYFPLDPIRFTLAEMSRGEHVVFKCNEDKLWAIGWHDHHYKCYVTTHGTTIPGKPADKKRQDNDTNVNFAINVPRPEVIAKYQQEMGHVDRHNFYRQGILKLHTTWKTKRWQTRIILEILAITLVDAFLAAKKLLPRWRDETDEESVFWKFVCALIPQIDPRPANMRIREDAVDPVSRCVQVRLGEKKTKTRLNSGTYRAVQGRCSSCRARNKLQGKKGRAPNTAWGCVCHPGKYFCRRDMCWAEHLRAVRVENEIEMAI